MTAKKGGERGVRGSETLPARRGTESPSNC